MIARDREMGKIGTSGDRKQRMSIYHADMNMPKAASQSAFADLAFCQQHEGEMMSLLRKMVEMESPSDDKAAVDSMGAFLAEEFERRWWQGHILSTARSRQSPESRIRRPLPASPCFCWDTLTLSGRWALLRKCLFILKTVALLVPASMT